MGQIRKCKIDKPTVNFFCAKYICYEILDNYRKYILWLT
jgi:hypothetical protein